MPEVNKPKPAGVKPVMLAPVTAGREMTPDLSEVHSNFLMAELIRRGYRPFMTPEEVAANKAPVAATRATPGGIKLPPQPGKPSGQPVPQLKPRVIPQPQKAPAKVGGVLLNRKKPGG